MTLHASEYDLPYEGNEEVWKVKPRHPSPTPKAIRRHANEMLAAGRLHPDAWAGIDDHLLAGDIEQAAFALKVSVAPTPLYPITPGPRGTET